MSGIAGIIRFDGQPVDVNVLNSMADRLCVRGPDSVNIRHEKSAGMVHTMLWTTPESLNETLPLVDNEAGLILTADARIDNRDELSNRLGIQKTVAADLSDSEMILLAYKKWGEACPEKFVGDFAFAVWNRRNQTLFCARDHMGVKPFYYYRCENFIVFASEIKALFCWPEVPRKLNNARLTDYLYFVYSDNNSTFYQRIYRLPNASSMVVNSQSIIISNYFTFDPENRIRLKSQGEYAEAFREVFETAVRSHLRSAYPVGSALSGGMDSSSIACVSRNHLKKNGQEPLHTFSVIFPGLPPEQFKKVDERIYMDAVVDQGGIIPHFIRADKTGPFTDMKQALDRFDEPPAAINGYIHVAMYKKAKELGVRVFLDGTDGDTTVSHGYERLTELGHHGKIWSLLCESKDLSLRRGTPFSARKTIYGCAIRHRIPGGMLERIRRWRSRPTREEIVVARLRNEFQDMDSWGNREKEILGYSPGKYADAHIKHAQSLSHPIYQYVMELIDVSVAGHGLEARYPFWDRRLMEFCLALPSDQKLSRGVTRAVLHKGMKGILPDLVKNRVNKANLSPNAALKISEIQPDFVNELLFSVTSPVRSLIDVCEVRRQWEACVKKPFENTQLVPHLYALMALSLWLGYSGLSLEEK